MPASCDGVARHRDVSLAVHQSILAFVPLVQRVSIKLWSTGKRFAVLVVLADYQLPLERVGGAVCIRADCDYASVGADGGIAIHNFPP
jgi:hypothetical protein